MTWSRVLVLNQNYQPLNICDVRRAISLLGRGKAEPLVEMDDRLLRSANFSFPEPSVIRLVYLVKRPYHHRRLSRREVFMRDRHRCQYCGKEARTLTLDHVIPRSRGGEHTWANVVTACSECNHRKAGRTPSEASMRLLRRPAAPKANPFAFFIYREIRDSWRPFIPWLSDGARDGISGDSVLAAGG